MEKLSRILGMRLMSIKEGKECGQIKETIIDAEKKNVCFLVLDTGKGCFGLKAIPVTDLCGAGDDFVISKSIEGVSAMWENEPAIKLGFTNNDIIGSTVISNDGNVLGTVSDFEFDLMKGEIETYFTGDGDAFERKNVLTLSKGVVFVSETDLSEEDEEAEEEAEAEEDEDDAKNVTPAASSTKTQKPKKTTKSAAKKPDEPSASDENYFEQRISQYLGKTITKNLAGDDGQPLANKGDIITNELIAKMKDAGKLIELSMCVE